MSNPICAQCGEEILSGELSADFCGDIVHDECESDYIESHKTDDARKRYIEENYDTFMKYAYEQLDTVERRTVFIHGFDAIDKLDREEIEKCFVNCDPAYDEFVKCELMGLTVQKQASVAYEWDTLRHVIADLKYMPIGIYKQIESCYEERLACMDERLRA